MTALVFRALDQHVVGGLADHPAIEDDRGPLSYAQLLHESACIAGALSHLGVGAGTAVAIDVPHGRELVIAVLAVARLGAEPQDEAGFTLLGVPPVLHAPDTEVAWDLLIRAGRSEPAPAPSRDPDGYEDLMFSAYPRVFERLIVGETVI